MGLIYHYFWYSIRVDAVIEFAASVGESFP
jgi:hypothetical protein